MTINLMLIPGLNNTSETWNQVIYNLPKDWNIKAINVPALSDVDQIADQLLEDITEPFYLCGFSFGGYVALAMLERAPELIQGFILLASSSTSDSEKQKEVRKQAIIRAEKGEYFEMMDANAPLTFHPNSLLNEEIVRLRSKIVQDYGADLFVHHVKATMGRPDRTKIFQNAPIPKLIIAGKEDRVIDPDKLLQLADATSHVEFNVIADTGHMIPLEQPVKVAKVIQNWIEQI
ncbi:alpha/beta fold hydrolase [Psychrobacillus soli]|uniref:Alpha/beta hydrolase n=1 Tax=Psychrobacillus soli TaxID=1543965 RepID=A0A544SWT7_9BACI|nr:alpha/beta hydrolase [Psychrobacillus soli]TQR09658.1 alpha/beta hydrolase [Psychrobacillus soli]